MTRKLVGTALMAMLALVPFADAAKRPPVKAPKSGQYEGHPGGKDLTLYVSGKSIELATFSFKCGGTGARTNLNEIPLKKTSKGYRFRIDAHGNVSFADEQPDENAKVFISGLFTRSGKKATGVFRVRSKRCHDTGNVKWSARR